MNNFTRIDGLKIKWDKVGQAFLQDARKILRGTGVQLIARGRNKCRWQFAREFNDARIGESHRSLRRDLPLRYATHAILYLRSRSPGAANFAEARGMVGAILKVYALHAEDVVIA